MRTGPTFIGVGVQKAATTWLHDVLAAHPDVFTSEPKELDFFTHHYNRGYEWYERHFDSAGAAVARGESSPSYLYDPSAPERVRRYRADMRLIAVLRDPVDRAYSNHLHVIRNGSLVSTKVFEEAEPLNPMYVEQGRYATHLERWIESFGRDALLILLTEDISADPETALDATYAHIGVSRGFRPPRFGERRHESVAPKNEALQSALRTGGDALRAVGLSEGLERIKRVGPVNRLLKLNQRDLRHEAPPMKAETRARLQETFADEVVRLAAILGRDSLPWPTWRAATSR